jgi:hypothetical protein
VTDDVDVPISDADVQRAMLILVGRVMSIVPAQRERAIAVLVEMLTDTVALAASVEESEPTMH